MGSSDADSGELAQELLDELSDDWEPEEEECKECGKMAVLSTSGLCEECARGYSIGLRNQYDAEL